MTFSVTDTSATIKSIKIKNMKINLFSVFVKYSCNGIAKAIGKCSQIAT